MSPFSAARSISSRPTRQVSRRKSQREMDDEEMGETNSSPQEEENEGEMESEVAYKKPRRATMMGGNQGRLSTRPTTMSMGGM